MTATVHDLDRALRLRLVDNLVGDLIADEMDENAAAATLSALGLRGDRELVEDAAYARRCRDGLLDLTLTPHELYPDTTAPTDQARGTYIDMYDADYHQLLDQLALPAKPRLAVVNSAALTSSVPAFTSGQIASTGFPGDWPTERAETRRGCNVAAYTVALVSVAVLVLGAVLVVVTA